MRQPGTVMTDPCLEPNENSVKKPQGEPPGKQ